MALERKQVLVLEPFSSGSHAQLVKCLSSLSEYSPAKITVVPYTLEGKKWHWRARAGSLWYSQTVPLVSEPLPTIFASSMLNLTELFGLRPDLQQCTTILYFHENQLEYPRRGEKLDFHFGWIQILSCLAADKVVFNSLFNMRMSTPSLQ